MKGKITKKGQKVYEDDQDANLGYYDPANDGEDDRDYQKLLTTTSASKKKKNNDYFLTSDKYMGKKVDQMEQQSNQDILKSGEQQEPDFQQEIKHTLSQIKTDRQKKSKLLEEDLKKIDEQDEQRMAEIKKTSAETGNPIYLKNQLHQFSKMAEIRYFCQKNVQQIKRMPTQHFPQSSNLALAERECEKVLKSEISSLIKNHEALAMKIFYPHSNQVQAQESKQNGIQLSVPEQPHQPYQHTKQHQKNLWKKFQQETVDINKKLQQEIISWSQRTNLLKSSSQHNRSQYNSLLMQTPIGQAEKVIKDWNRVSKKSQQKRAPFRIFFQPETNIQQTHNPQIYDDLDLMQEVQKIYQQQIQKDGEDKQFMIGDTMKYLQRKNGQQKVQKNVDRKASKNRKIRFNVHAKLLNFIPCQLENLLEARDEIVSNLFSRGSKEALNKDAQDYIDM